MATTLRSDEDRNAPKGTKDTQASAPERDRRLDLAQSVVNSATSLQTLEQELRQVPGMHEVADAVRRAYLELAHPSVQGPLNHLELESVELSPGHHDPDSTPQA